MPLQKERKQFKKIKAEDFFLPLLIIFFSLVYLGQVWGEPKVVILWPYIVITLLLSCSILIVIIAAKKNTENQNFFSKLGLKRAMKPLLLSGTTVIYLIGINYLGFSLTNFFYLILLFWSLGTKQFWTVVGLSLLISIILHIIIVEFLQMPVPRITIPWSESPI